MEQNDHVGTRIYRLARADLKKVERLFGVLDEHLAPQAVIAGGAPGTIYVDHPVEPCAALLHVQQRLYLAGDVRRQRFNEGLYALFDEVIYPQAQEAGQQAFTLTYTPGWEGPIEAVILRDKHPIRDQRHTYAFKELRDDWRTLLKPGYALRQVDATLLEDRHLANVAALQAETLSEAPSTALFLRDRFGVCLIKYDEVIVGWALSEYNLGKRCEVGIETVEGYRRHGIATLTGSALVEEALSRGITRIGWHCWASNTGSIATALRIGFKKVDEFDVYFAWFDKQMNLAVNGNMQFFQGAYGTALTWYERALALGDAPWWIHWNAARAAATLDRRDIALHYLQKAVEGGFHDIEAIQGSPYLEALNDMEGWQKILASLNREA